MTTFDIRLFGAIEIRRDGELLTDFRSQKALVLLAYLICENRPITRDYLAGLAWPEMEQRQALGLLRRSLHDLNNQLPGCLELDRRTVCFSPTAPATVDIRMLANDLALNDLAGWTTAAASYHAPFLHGIYIDDAPDLEHWLLRQQEHWQQRAIGVLQALIQHYTAEAAYALALRYVQQLLALEPWREEEQRRAMLLLARTGQGRAALAQYATCRQILRTELDVEPDDETEILYQRIKVLAHTAPTHLPVDVTPFVGRTAELTQLRRLLATANCRLITIIGAGGMGKTRLALAVARLVTSKTQCTFLHGVAFAALASVDTPAQLVSTLAQALALPLQAQGDPETQLLYYLQDKELLLLLDNFEHLISERTVAFVLKLLEQAPQVKVLITARTRLHLQAEQLYWVQGLAVPATPPQFDPAQLDTDAMLNFSALQLFIASAQRLRAEYAVSAADLPALLDLCQLVQGMPLALELAATWTSVLSLAEIADQIQQNLDFLTSNAQDLPLRQRSMRAVFTTSWRRLSSDEQRVLQQLSLFRGGFTRQLASEVAGANPTLLAKLVDQSLINCSPQRRYMLHELIRQFAAEELTQAGELTTTAQRHAGALLRYTSQYQGEARYADTSRWLEAILTEYDNIEAALRWCFSTEEPGLGLEIVCALGDFWYRYGNWPSGRTWLECALHSTASRDRPDLRAAALNELGVLLLRMDEPQAAWQAHTESLQIFRQLGVEREIAWTCYHMASKAFYLGEYAPAQAVAAESLAIFRRLGDQRGSAAALARVATLWLEGNGDWVRAEPLLVESLTIARQIQENRLIDGALIMLGQVAEQQGDLVQAEAYLTESLAGLPSKEGKSWALGKLGKVFLAGGKVTQAAHCFQEALQLRQDLGDREAIAWMLESLADVALFRQEFAQAAFLLGIAHSLRLKIHAEKSGNEAVILANTQAEIKLQLGEAPFTAAWDKGIQVARQRTDFTNLIFC